ncbi:hypothetical protein FRC08_005956 [Ceratobasidium sp. 394]|nr:hypothetical protein FRC08_005956 [Ceratobasidium sp. 394]
MVDAIFASDIASCMRSTVLGPTISFTRAEPWALLLCLNTKRRTLPLLSPRLAGRLGPAIRRDDGTARQELIRPASDKKNGRKAVARVNWSSARIPNKTDFDAPGKGGPADLLQLGHQLYAPNFDRSSFDTT